MNLPGRARELAPRVSQLDVALAQHALQLDREHGVLLVRVQVREQARVEQVVRLVVVSHCDAAGREGS